MNLSEFRNIELEVIIEMTKITALTDKKSAKIMKMKAELQLYLNEQEKKVEYTDEEKNELRQIKDAVKKAVADKKK